MFCVSVRFRTLRCSFLSGLVPSANVDGGFEVSPLFCASNRAVEWGGLEVWEEVVAQGFIHPLSRDLVGLVVTFTWKRLV